MIEIYESMLDALRERVMQKTSPKRFRHTVAVEEMVSRLAALYCPEKTSLLRAAALLHDVTKELSLDEQIALCRDYGLEVAQEAILAPKTMHARTAAALIGAEYPELADPALIDAVRWHTTGRENMTIEEKLLYLADYIDESRSFPSCVLLRRYFWGADPASMTDAERADLLRDTLILSFDMTVKDLVEEGSLVAIDTAKARNYLLAERAERR